MCKYNWSELFQLKLRSNMPYHMTQRLAGWWSNLAKCAYVFESTVHGGSNDNLLYEYASPSQYVYCLYSISKLHVHVYPHAAAFFNHSLVVRAISLLLVVPYSLDYKPHFLNTLNSPKKSVWLLLRWSNEW